MGCLNVDITRIGASPIVDILRLGDGLQAEAYRATEPLSAMVYDITPRLTISIGLICSINGAEIIRFEKSKLVWNSKEDNQVGVIKYNLLTASDDWILEEIEELL